jgi:hypothetical protein
MFATESKRLATVRKFEHLNLNDNKELKDLVSLTSQICNTSMASVTIMDSDTQWLKCASGLKNYQQKRQDSFCQYLINTKKVMVVPDALLDSRFASIPSVAGEAGIRFYAGVPLITTTGYHLGALCVFDTEPQSLTNKQKEMLAFVGRQIMHMMEMLLGLDFFKQHHADLDFEKRKLSASENKLKAFFNGSNSSHVLVNKSLNVIEFNKSSSVSFKKLYAKRISKGKNVLHYISSSFKADFLRCLKRAFTGKRTSKEVLMHNNGDTAQWYDIRLEPVFDEFGKTESVAYSTANINDQKRQVAEIIEKNESLLNIAYIQSHGYRKPVASILGLMNVIKENNYESSKECLILMEHAVKELDEKIKSVVGHTQINK